ncbi:MAG: glycosyltransferase family 39 protein [Bacteroidales bacterium]|nr:glycosyltransferase family 39 protein [Bacteroidales bacterium]
MYKNNRLEFFVLFFSILFLWAFYIFGFEGYYGWDDMEYARLAYQWAKGNLTLSENHFAYRHPPIIITGMSYRLFGVSDFASALPALLMSSLIIVTVFVVLRKSDTRVVITATILTLLMPYFIMYSHKLMADMYVAWGIFGSTTVLYFYKFHHKKQPYVWALLFCVCLWFAFLTKEVILIFLPVLCIIAIYDILHKENIAYWLWVIAYNLLFALIYHAIIWKLTGNPWSRYVSIEQNAYINPCSYEQLPLIFTLRRILYEFWNESLKSGLLWLMFFIIIPMFKGFKRRKFLKPEFYWIFIAIVSIMLANFMTKSYKAYSPMCVDMRHYLYLIPLFTVAAAPHIVQFFFRPRANWILWTIIMVASIAYFAQIINVKQWYNQYFVFTVLGIVLLVTIRSVVKKISTNTSTILWLLFLILWLVFPIHQMVRQSNNPFKHIKPFIEKHFHTTKPTIVLADPILKRIADFCMTWDSTYVRFVNERSPEIPYYDSTKDYYVYHNGLTWWFLEKKYPEPMQLWYLKEPNIQLRDSAYGNYLFKVVKPDSIHRPTDTLSYFCDLEMISIPFIRSNEILDSTVSFTGNYSCQLKPRGFSTTFIKKLEPIITAKTSKIEIALQAKILVPKRNQTKMVVSVVDSIENNVFWLGKSVMDLVQASNKWQDVLFRASIKPTIANKDLRVKVYFWNDDTSSVWIDNIHVEIIRIEHL